MDAKSVRNMESIIAVTNRHTAKLHHVGSLYILTQYNSGLSMITSKHFCKKQIDVHCKAVCHKLLYASNYDS